MSNIPNSNKFTTRNMVPKKQISDKYINITFAAKNSVTNITNTLSSTKITSPQKSTNKLTEFKLKSKEISSPKDVSKTILKKKESNNIVNVANAITNSVTKFNSTTTLNSLFKSETKQATPISRRQKYDSNFFKEKYNQKTSKSKKAVTFCNEIEEENNNINNKGSSNQNIFNTTHKEETISDNNKNLLIPTKSLSNIKLSKNRFSTKTDYTNKTISEVSINNVVILENTQKENNTTKVIDCDNNNYITNNATATTTNNNFNGNLNNSSSNSMSNSKYLLDIMSKLEEMIKVTNSDTDNYFGNPDGGDGANDKAGIDSIEKLEKIGKGIDSLLSESLVALNLIKSCSNNTDTENIYSNQNNSSGCTTNNINMNLNFNNTVVKDSKKRVSVYKNYFDICKSSILDVVTLLEENTNNTNDNNCNKENYNINSKENHNIKNKDQDHDVINNQDNQDIENDNDETIKYCYFNTENIKNCLENPLIYEKDLNKGRHDKKRRSRSSKINLSFNDLDYEVNFETSINDLQINIPKINVINTPKSCLDLLDTNKKTDVGLGQKKYLCTDINEINENDDDEIKYVEFYNDNNESYFERHYASKKDTLKMDKASINIKALTDNKINNHNNNHNNKNNRNTKNSNTRSIQPFLEAQKQLNLVGIQNRPNLLLQKTTQNNISNPIKKNVNEKDIENYNVNAINVEVI